MKNKLVSYLVLLCMVIMFSFSYANELPIESNVPGGIVIVSIKSKDRPKAFFYDKKVLVVDLDPQGNATTGFGISATEGKTTIYDVLNGNCSFEESIQDTKINNLSA